MPIDHGDAETEVALLIMRDAAQQHHEHDADVKNAKQQYIQQGAEQVQHLRDAADHDRSAAYAGALCTGISGALEIGAAAAAPALSSGSSGALEGMEGGGEVVPEEALDDVPEFGDVSVGEDGLESGSDADLEDEAAGPDEAATPTPSSFESEASTATVRDEAPRLPPVPSASEESSFLGRGAAAAPKALADVSGRAAPFVATLAGGARAQEDRADAAASEHASQVAKMDYDEARERTSRDRDAGRSAFEGLRSATAAQHEARMTVIRG